MLSTCVDMRKMGIYAFWGCGLKMVLKTIIEENPDVLFVVKSGGNPEEAADFFRQHAGLQSLKVVREGKVYGISLNYTYNSAIKTGEGIKKFAHGMYPELF